jgi:hypothetical protein
MNHENNTLLQLVNLVSFVSHNTPRVCIISFRLSLLETNVVLNISDCRVFFLYDCLRCHHIN